MRKRMVLISVVLVALFSIGIVYGVEEGKKFTSANFPREDFAQRVEVVLKNGDTKYFYTNTSPQFADFPKGVDLILKNVYEIFPPNTPLGIPLGHPRFSKKIEIKGMCYCVVYTQK